MKNPLSSSKTSGCKKKRISLLTASLLGLLLLICGISVWLGLFFFPGKWNFVSVAALLLGAVAVYFAVHFSACLLYLTGWRAIWVVRLFGYAVVIFVLLKRGQTAAEGPFLLLWWILFFLLIFLEFFPIHIHKK